MRGTIQQKGKRFYIVWDTYEELNGKKVRKPKWIPAGETMEQAEEKRIELNYLSNRGELHLISKKTLDEFLQQWLVIAIKPPKRSLSTYEGYKGEITNHISPALGHLEMDRITQIDLDTYFSSKPKLSGATMCVHHQILSKAFDYAFNNKIIERNVMANVERPKKRKYKAPDLDLETTLKIFQAVQKKDSIRIPISITIFTGMRRGEVLGLKWDCVDLEKGVISVERSLAPDRSGKLILSEILKTDSSVRKIPISNTILLDLLKAEKCRQNALRVRLKDAYKNDGYVCCRSDGTPLRPPMYVYNFHKLLESIGVQKLRPHDLRHGIATILFASGVQMEVVSKLLGHSNTATTELYAHINKKETEFAVSRFNDLIKTELLENPLEDELSSPSILLQ